MEIDIYVVGSEAMLQIIYYLLFAVNVIYAIHFATPFVIGLWKKKKETLMHEKECTFAILIPARNEEFVIGNLLDSLMHQNYPKEKYQIYVLINHCTDQTKQIAYKKGVNIIDCPDTVKSKGDVLQYAFSSLQKEPIDAYLIFDADNVVHPDFCKYMNQSYQNGNQVAQAFRDSKNSKVNWLSGGYSIFYYIQNIYFETRRKLGISASLSGTGWMVKKSMIDTYGYPMTTLLEDLEYSAFSILHNTPIDFVPKAIIYDEQPTQFTTSWRQRKRWTTGAYQCFKKYWHILWKGTKQKISKLDLFLIFFSPLLQVLTCTVGVLNLVYVGLKYGFFNLLFSGVILLLITYAIICLFAAFVVQYNGKNPSQMRKTILLFPIFLSTWLPIQFICLFKGVKQWEEIEHKSNLKLEEISH